LRDGPTARSNLIILKETQAGTWLIQILHEPEQFSSERDQVFSERTLLQSQSSFRMCLQRTQGRHRPVQTEQESQESSLATRTSEDVVFSTDAQAPDPREGQEKSAILRSTVLKSVWQFSQSGGTRQLAQAAQSVLTTELSQLTRVLVPQRVTV